MHRRFKRTWPTQVRGAEPETNSRASNEHDAIVNALERIADVFDAGNNTNEILAQIAEIARHVTSTDAAQIFLLEPKSDRLVLRADTHNPEQAGRVAVKMGQGLTGWAAQHQKPVAIGREPWKDPRFLDYPGMDERGFQSLMCVPLVASGEMIGVVNVKTVRQHGYSSGHSVILSKIADQVARALRRQSEVESLASRVEQFEAVTEVTEVIARSPYLEEILQLLVSFTAERFSYTVVTVRLLDEERGELVLRATQSQHYAYRRKRSIRVGESFAGRAVVEKTVLTSEDVSKDEEYIGADMAAEQGLKSMVCVPLLVRDNAIGVMTCYTSDLHSFARAELKALEALAKQAAIAIEHAKLQVRSTLMQEMHHRVKNNLQQIVSILRLQSSEATHKSVEEVVSDSIRRIGAIAGVHDLLSREDLDRVGISSVADSLVQHHQQGLISPGRRITMRVAADDIPIGMNHATQVALILNELLSNAIEHGFEHAEEGEIRIEIHRMNELVVMEVQNSGDNLPEDFECSLDGHLGLKIVDSLTRATGGSFTLENRHNWVVARASFAVSSFDFD